MDESFASGIQLNVKIYLKYFIGEIECLWLKFPAMVSSNLRPILIFRGTSPLNPNVLNT